MQSIRDAIVRMVQGHHPGFGFTEIEWDSIQAAIDAAQPPGVDEIYVALHELDAAMPDCAMHHITLYGTGNSGIHSGRGRERGSDIKAEDIPAAIRDLIPKPVPTPEEDCDTIGCVVVLGSKAHHALARIRKLIPEQ